MILVLIYTNFFSEDSVDHFTFKNETFIQKQRTRLKQKTNVKSANKIGLKENNQSRPRRVKTKQVKLDFKPKEFYEVSKEEKNKIIKEIIKKSKVTPLIPPNYDFKEIKTEYNGVSVVQAKHNNKDVTINTLVSEVPLDRDDWLEAAHRLFSVRSIDDFEYIDYDISHPDLEKIQVIESDGNLPIYVVKGNVKGSQKEVYFTVNGKVIDVNLEIDNIKKEFQKIKVVK